MLTNSATSQDSKAKTFLPPLKRISDIEVLRALAILTVIISHLPALLFWWPKTLTWLFGYATGWGGVDIFFAISGFVIARDLIPRLQLTSSRMDFWRVSGAFWIRRAFRIIPAAWFWVVITCALCVIFNRSGAFGIFKWNLDDAVAIVMQVANLHFFDCRGAQQCGVNGVYWSLALEDQFYFCLPILFLVTGRHLTKMIVLLIALQIFLYRPVWSLTWVFRSDAILLGVLIAIWCKHETYRLFEPTFLRNKKLGFPAILILIVSALIVPEYLPFKNGIITPSTGLLAVISASLVWIASYDRDYIAGSRIAKLIFGWIGSRSFSLYLAHMPIFFLIREFFFRVAGPGTTFDSRYNGYFLAAAIPALLGAAEFSYRVVERHLRIKGAEVARRFADPAPIHSTAALQG
jgi:peptidoglycan/LPS O-acetylase OafA/YrhL